MAAEGSAGARNGLPAIEESVSANELQPAEESVSDNELPSAEESVSANELPSIEESVSANELPPAEKSVSDNELPPMEESVSANDLDGAAALSAEPQAIAEGSRKYEFKPSDLTAEKDKEEIADGTDIADYFTTKGKVTKRTSSSTGAVTSIEVDKKGSGWLEFTVTGTADVELQMSSNGGSNTSAVALTDESGKVIANQEGITTVTGTGATKMTYFGLVAGTYKILSPEDPAYNRGARILSVVVTEIDSIREHEFKPSDLTAEKDKEEMADGTVIADYFTTKGKVTKRTSSSTGAVTSIEVDKKGSGWLEFTVTGTADVELQMSSNGGSNTSAVALTDESGKVIANQEGITTVTGTGATKMTYFGLVAGTYKILSPEDPAYNRGARIVSVIVTETGGGSKPPRAAWETVAAPVIDKVELAPDSGGSKINATVTGFVDYDGADQVKVTMADASGEVVQTASSSDKGNTHTLSFTPASSGDYIFQAFLTRKDETDKVSAAAEPFAFQLPLAAPVMKNAVSSGNGTVTVKWHETPEADGYVVTAVKAGEAQAAAAKETAALEVVLTGLIVGESYSISVTAKRSGEVSAPSEPIEVTVTQEAQRAWGFAAYGASTDTKNNGYEGGFNQGTVTIYSEGGKGKIQPTSHDGLAFYYTEIDPERENFTLTADIHLDSWTYSNAQEGFGLMAADAVGVNGDSASFYNNSMQAVASKIEYYYDGAGVTDDTSAAKITMKLGLGYTVKSGLTAQDVADINAGKKQLNEVTALVNESGTLETSAGPKGAGTYNLFGNYTKETGGVDLNPLLTDIRLQLQRNNTGYIMRYLDKENNILGEKLFYDLERTALTQIDADHIYVGFFASRNARITVTNMTLTTIAPEDDEASQDREIEYISPSYVIESAAVSNSSEYTLVYYGNADGTLTIRDGKGKVIVDGVHVSANTKNPFPAVLAEGKNVFTITFAPDADYRPSEFQRLNSYEPKTFTHTVTYSSFNAEQNIYVAPGGSGDGSKNDPADIYYAVQFAKPGQYILLAGGDYKLNKTVKVERGIDGSQEKRIYMIADPEAKERPVFDFGGSCAGMIFAGDYWYFRGFDVTGSKNGEKGIQVSGDHNVLDQIRAYKNGNTGIQISRYMGTDAFEDWPAHNLILNCTSYLNADSGYEDADGFAAKLTVGEGNVFDGCIAAYNADDGWDLFAKVQTGSIGSVVIQNSVAFKNGYVLKTDGVLDINGQEVNAGNGNGFKMGGDSLPGGHTLRNSIAFDNKAKGIDSNSCPDIKVYSSTAFDNESYNVAFYTNNAPDTDFDAKGILSLKETNAKEENLKPTGSQNKSKVYSDLNYYYDGSKSVNQSGAEASLDWFVKRDVENAKFLLTDKGRNADGSINMGGLLELTDEVPEGVGARMTGNSFDEELPELKLSRTADVVTGVPEDSVSQEILEKVGCGDVKELEKHLTQELKTSPDAKKTLGGEPEGTAVYEVKVEVTLDGGKTWVSADADNFPKNGVDVIIPYPEGTNQTGFTFAVSHLIVLGCNGQEPGTIESLTPKKTKSGLVVHVMSASPFTVGWKKVSAQQSGSAGTGGEESGGGDNGGSTAVKMTTDPAGNNSENLNLSVENQKKSSGKAKSPKTDDTGNGAYSEDALKKIVEKTKETDSDPAAGESVLGQKEEASVGETGGVPVVGMTSVNNGESHVFGWLLAGAAVLLALGFGGAAVWNRKRTGRKE